MSDQQPTSHLSGYQRDPRNVLSLNRAGKSGQQRNDNQGGEKQKKKGPVGHDRQLEELSKSGELVTILTNASGPLSDVRIVRRCKFTITVAVGGDEIIFFKHALLGIRRKVAPTPAVPAIPEDKSLD